ncbi:aconitate hydratase AcnA [Nocardioides zeae]|uniref:Aconitate hydratase n=1 Tax=Nocardioides imazamoxiresistens TaxID=3231893 RepID=A0ABU3PQQ9_9ACTN|nr:aconitate hydratase AcnA [Nocardioides zeae]MDT9591559.1 aconitate hydratase AcnA [Nocardioides zeae]
MTPDSFHSRSTLDTPLGPLTIHRLDAVPGSEALPFAHKVVLENLLRHEDGETVTADDVRRLVEGGAPDLAFHASRVFLHDTNGVPVLTDLAALREAVVGHGLDAAAIDAVVPAQLTVDHSVAADHVARPDAPLLNVRREYERNAERYRFLKWGEQAFDRLAVVPPGAGIMHQINIERLADVVTVRDGAAFPDTVAGTDSHTTMVNGLGVLGWGVGGIEAEAAMLGQPVSLLLPPVVGVELVGDLRPGVTATDLVLTLTERLRALGVVGSFVEFFGAGVAATSVATRCTIANMSPEFGSTSAVFPIDAATIAYLRLTGRDPDHVAVVEAYARAQGLWHDPAARPRYDRTVVVDLDEVRPSLAGPRRPQDRHDLAGTPVAAAAAIAELAPPDLAPHAEGAAGPQHGAVAIAAITSCTNTSNPAVMVAAGLLARNAVERGLVAAPWVKTSLAPGSKVVTDYLERSGLLPALEKLGFGLVGYGCMTCIGNSGALLPDVERAVRADGLVAASVTSGNRNFDGRINNDVALNFLASPPLVVAYALAGSVAVDLTAEPLGHDEQGRPVHLADVWPSEAEIAEVVAGALEPAMFTDAYATLFDGDDNWRGLDAPTGPVFPWDEDSTYLQRPPFLDVPAGTDRIADLHGARVLAVLGDSVTTDHICPAGRVPTESAAGRFLTARGVAPRDLNTYASRRGNWQVMLRGGFANPRLRERGEALGERPADEQLAAVAERHRAAGTPLVVLAGKEYGTGSSRDWAAKVTALLGVRVVLAESFERIHRGNLVGMGVLPLQLLEGDTVASLGLSGDEEISVTGLEVPAAPGAPDARRLAERVQVEAVDAASGRRTRFEALVRVDTAREEAYLRAGGLLPYVLAQVLRDAR